jgi:two-component system NarL family response regulator
MTAPQRFKVLVCHDSAVLQAGLMALLVRHADFDCAAGEAAAAVDGHATLPKVVIADHGRAMQLVSSAGRSTRAGEGPRVLVVAQAGRECEIRAALSAGVQGYFLVDDVAEHLPAAIRVTRPDARVLSPRVASRLAEIVAAEALTQREQSVLELVVEGLCNKSIGRQLGISAGTVKSHLRSAFGKLGVVSRTQAIATAHRRGLLQQ